METLAVVVEAPGEVALRRLGMMPPEGNDVIVSVDFSGISMGTEKLLYNGTMPVFPGLGYPLVPGYEAVGRIVDAGEPARSRIGEAGFVPGSSKFIGARGLFGGSAQTLITGTNRVLSIPSGLGEQAVLLSLAATARHAMVGGALPDLVIGHGVLGRLIARMAVAQGQSPTVWEIALIARMAVAQGLSPTVWEIAPERMDGGEIVLVGFYAPFGSLRVGSIYDCSGDSDIIDPLVMRMAPGGEIVLVGFYAQPLHFNFAPAFRREMRMRIATEFQPQDLADVIAMVDAGTLSLDGLVTNRVPANDAATAYGQAFTNPSCLKMVFDWRNVA
ncbi:chlorophyll synthesis pathway protein BchC [Polymorphobacter multimanifer]|uniref:chlorophyll synthesis pathway protein BchC n=1 Tax=Polymorphobacter multimanifer TaxID=1070431 RepID=UPI00166AE8D7|nr:chlorophyll synthesis pathway protein BchC [Polymorphobacter multimanifer]GGI72381.1 chlorophyll synthesis pathway protein BchC [Polymorphobacter multimanifer]